MPACFRRDSVLRRSLLEMEERGEAVNPKVLLNLQQLVRSPHCDLKVSHADGW